jgi:hypothetical protein
LLIDIIDQFYKFLVSYLLLGTGTYI